MTIFYGILAIVALVYLYCLGKALGQEKPKKIDEVLSVFGVITITWGVTAVFFGALACLLIGLPVAQNQGHYDMINRADPVEIFQFKVSEKASPAYIVAEKTPKELMAVFFTKNKFGDLEKVSVPMKYIKITGTKDKPYVQMAQYRHQPPEWLGMGRIFCKNDLVMSEIYVPRETLVKPKR